jgi:hypothetical protein
MDYRSQEKWGQVGSTGEPNELSAIIMTAQVISQVSLDNKTLLTYANDMALISMKPTDIQKSLDSARKWTEENKMQIDKENVKAPKFRKSDINYGGIIHTGK